MEFINKADDLIDSAQNCVKQKEFQKAIQVLKKSLEFAETPKGYLLLAQAYYNLSQYSECLESVEKGISQLPSIPNESLRNSILEKLLSQKTQAQDHLSPARTDTETPPPSEEHQKDSKNNFFELSKKHSKDKDWFLVSKEWLDTWESYLEGTANHPGRILNSNLLLKVAFVGPEKGNYLKDPQEEQANLYLKDSILENKDYILVPSTAYEYLKESYGSDKDIKRCLVPLTEEGDLMQVEVKLKPVRVVPIPSFQETLETPKHFQVSKKAKVGDLKSKLQDIYKELYPRSLLDFSQARLWKVTPDCKLTDFHPTAKSILIESAQLLPNKTVLEEAQVADEDIIIVEFKQKDWTIHNKPQEICISCRKIGNMLNCASCKSVKYCSKECQRQHWKYHKELCKKVRESQVHTPASRNGMTGLQNLGNTCFMNSALQCVSHTLPLTEYFLNNKFVADINPNNPLGTKGAALAYAFAELITDLWKGSSRSLSPWNFKRVIAKFAPQFTGYQQHDSAELLSYLLTGLHEDLNRVRDKPYIEQPEAEGKSEKEAAEMFWDWFKKRNQSIIVDLMYGQYKSTLQCPECERISITYDPYLTFSLSIPNYDVKLVSVLLMKLGDLTPVKYTFKMNASFKVCDLKKAIKEVWGVENFRIAAYLKETIKGFLPDNREIGELDKKTLVAFEFPEDYQSYELVPLVISKLGERGYFSKPSKFQISFMRLLFFKRSESTLSIQKEIVSYLSQVVVNNLNKSVSEPAEMLAELKATEEPLYSLNIVNTSKKTQGLIWDGRLPCDFCGDKKCENCPFPMSQNTKLSDLLDQVQNSEGPFMLEVVFSSKTQKVSLLNSVEEHSSPQNIEFEKKSSITLYDCLEHSTNSEVLDEDNKWYCSKCKKHVQATKTYQIYSLPKVLIIHLMRFKTRGFWREKNNSLVEFPLEGLDLSEYVLGNENPGIYDLYGVSNHMGSLGGGHYTAYVKSPAAESWLEMEDSRVSKTSPGRVVSPSAYILFYLRRS